MKISSTSGGRARNRSTQAQSGQATQRLLTVESSARMVPPITPSGITRMESQMVTLKPCQRIGQACSRMSSEKKASRKSSKVMVSPLPCEAGLDPAAEDHHRDEQDHIGDRAERQRRRVE